MMMMYDTDGCFGSNLDYVKSYSQNVNCRLLAQANIATGDARGRRLKSLSLFLSVFVERR